MPNVIAFSFISEIEFLKTIASKIVTIANERIGKSNVFSIVLTGGNTAKKLYPVLAQTKTDWTKWVFYFGDERYVGEDNSELNFNLAKEFLFSKISSDIGKFSKFDTRLSHEGAALDYERQLMDVDTFDLVLFGLGNDGHIASLFPGQVDHLNLVSDSVAIVTNSPKDPSNRLTLTLNRLNRSRHHIIMTEKKGKEKVIADILDGSILYPISELSPIESLKLFYLE